MRGFVTEAFVDRDGLWAAHASNGRYGAYCVHPVWLVAVKRAVSIIDELYAGGLVRMPQFSSRLDARRYVLSGLGEPWAYYVLEECDATQST